jgi:hypothetical protein
MRNRIRVHPWIARGSALVVAAALVAALSSCGGSESSTSSSVSRKASGVEGFEACFLSRVPGASVTIEETNGSDGTSALTSSAPVCGEDQTGMKATLKVASSNAYRIELGRYLEDVIVVEAYGTQGNVADSQRIVLPEDEFWYRKFGTQTSEIVIERLADSGGVREYRVTLR